jgi:hypothetical protein
MGYEWGYNLTLKSYITTLPAIFQGSPDENFDPVPAPWVQLRALDAQNVSRIREAHSMKRYEQILEKI